MTHTEHEQPSSQDGGTHAFGALKSWIRNQNLEVNPVKGRHAFVGPYTHGTENLTCYYQVFIELEQFIFYAVPNFSVPAERRLTAAEYITRVNAGMRIGNFELDFSDGQIRFKSSINFRNETLTEALITGTVEPAFEACNTYLKGLRNVIEGLQTPLRAINAIDYKT